MAGNWVNKGTIASVASGTLHLEPSHTFTNDVGGIWSVPAGIFSMEPGSTWTNLGTIAVSGGTLDLANTFTTAALGTFNRTGGTVNITGTLDNTGATLTLNSTTGSWSLAGGTLKGGTVNASGGAELLATATGGTLDGISAFNANLNATAANSIVTVLNGLTLNGTATLGTGSFQGQLRFSGTQSLLGSGTVSFQNTNTNVNTGILNMQAGQTLTIGPNMTIRGKTFGIGVVVGGVGTTNAAIVNQGTIRAEVANGTVAIDGTNWSNTGTISNTNSGAVNLNGSWSSSGTISNTDGGTINLTGTINNTGQTMTLSGPGTFALSGTITGGTVAVTNGAQLQLGNCTLNGVTFAAGSDVVTNTDATVNVLNGLTVNGKLTLGSGNTQNFAYGLYFAGSQTLGGSGEVFSSGGSQGLWVSQSSTTLTIGQNLLIHGNTFYLGASDGFSDSLSNTTLTNNGTIRADASSASRIGRGLIPRVSALTTFLNTTLGRVEVTNSAGALTLNTNTWTNSGTINVSAGTLNLAGSFTQTDIGSLSRTGGTAGTVNLTGTLTNTGTTLALDTVNNGRGTWNFSGTIVGGIVQTANGAQLLLSGGTLNGVTLSAGSDMVTTVDPTITVLNGLTVNGKLTLGSGNTQNFAYGLYFAGSQTLGGSGEVFSSGGSQGLWVSQSSTTLTIGQNLLIHGNTFYLGASDGFSDSLSNTTLTNNGTIRADASSASRIGRGLIPRVSALTTFLNTTLGRVEVTNSAGALTLNTNTWTNSGTINVSAGTLNLAGSFTQTDIGSLSRTGGTAGTVNLTGTLTNTGTTFALDTVNNGRGTWNFSGTIVGGIVQTANGAQLLLSGGTLNGVTLSAGSDMVTTVDPTITVLNGLTVNGKLTLGSGNTQNFAYGLYFAGSQTLGGSGEVFSSGGSQGLWVSQSSTTLTIGQNLLIHGNTFYLGASDGFSDSLSNTTLTNNGTIRADASSASQIGRATIPRVSTLTTFLNTTLGRVEVTNSAGALTLNTNTWTNSGTINVSAGTLNLGGSFTIDAASTITATGGAINISGTLQNTGNTLALSATTVTLAGGTIVGGTVSTSNGGQLRLTSGTLNGVTFAVGSDVVTTSGATITVLNGLTVNGTLQVGDAAGAGIRHPELPAVANHRRVR